ncbi:hypothetical protein GCM10022409_40040 [Hymenobacter glaciei]|uniref:Auto-transporter adhesin head GIN domain-containing protein n=1 Tax=Hymenobacter glaciei TaxID=877209 RepID=A0ABP7UPW1_9BACT
MKTITLFLAACVASAAAFGQGSTGVQGHYEQDAFIGPDNLKMTGQNVTLVSDPKLTNVVWIEHLLPGGRLKAIVHTKGDEKVIYAIPAQRDGAYQVDMGCVVYDLEDKKIVISLNNKDNCYGMKQSDYDSGVAITNGQIKAGGVEISGKKGIKPPGAQIGNGGIKVNTKAVMAGVQYIGHKPGAKSSSSDD